MTEYTEFKVKCQESGEYWNGDFYAPSTSLRGKAWKTLGACEAQVRKFLTINPDPLSKAEFKPRPWPKSWSVVEVKVREIETTPQDMRDFASKYYMSGHLETIAPKMGIFYEKLCEKHAEDGTVYIIMVSEHSGTDKHTITETKAYRDSLRQLHVLPSQYHEWQGFLGMMSRDDAMKARLVLPQDPYRFIDLAIERDRLAARLFGTY